MVSLHREPELNILTSIVISKNIYSNDKHLKFKSFLLD